MKAANYYIEQTRDFLIELEATQNLDRISATVLLARVKLLEEEDVLSSAQSGMLIKEIKTKAKLTQDEVDEAIF